MIAMAMAASVAMAFPVYEETVSVEFASEAEAQTAQMSIAPLPDGKKIAFTTRWDDSSPRHADRMEMLKRVGMNGTFFLNGVDNYFQDETSNGSRIKALGGRFGAHTFSHPHLMKAGADKMLHEALLSKIIIESASDMPVTSFVIPYDWNREDPSSAAKLVKILLDCGLFVSSDWPLEDAKQPASAWMPGFTFSANDSDPTPRLFESGLAQAIESVAKNPDYPKITFGIHSWCKPEGLLVQEAFLRKAIAEHPEFWVTDDSNYGAYRYEFWHAKAKKLGVEGRTATFVVTRHDPAYLGADVELDYVFGDVKPVKITKTAPGKPAPLKAIDSMWRGASAQFPDCTLTLAVDEQAGTLTYELKRADGQPVQVISAVVNPAPMWSAGRIVRQDAKATVALGEKSTEVDSLNGDRFYVVGIDFMRDGERCRLYADTMVKHIPPPPSITPQDTANAQNVFVPMEKVVNFGFADDVKNDVKGGWTDKGPSSDARYFPLEQKTFSGVPFKIIDPKTNDGKGVATFRGWQCDTRYIRAESVIPEPKTAKWMYVLHCSAWPQDKTSYAAFNLTDTTGRTERIELDPERDCADWYNPVDKPNAVIGAFFETEIGNGAAYVSKFRVPDGLGPVQKVLFDKFHSSGTTWLVLAVTLSDTDYPIEPEEIFITKADDIWRPMDVVEPYAKPGSALDFRFLGQKKTVAELGRVVAAPDGTLRYSKTGGKARFMFATSVLADLIMKPELTRDDVEMWVERMHVAGYNAYRYWVGGSFVDPKASKEELERRRDLFGWMVKCFRDRGMYFQLSLHCVDYAQLFDDPTGPQRWRDTVTELFNTVNPHTGIAYKDDESIAFVDLNNEIEFARFRSEHSKKVSLEQYTEDEMTLSRDERDLLRSLGYKGLIANCLMSSELRYTAHRWELMDFVSRNVYYQHPPNWTASHQTSSIRFAAPHIRTAFITATYQRPQILSEHGYIYQQKKRHDQAFVDAAYGALNDFAGMTAFRSPLGLPLEEGARMFMICHDPILRSAEYLKALMFLRGDVATSPVTLRYSANAADDLKRPFGDAPSSEPYAMGFVCRTVTDYSGAPKGENEMVVPRAGTGKAVVSVGDTSIQSEDASATFQTAFSAMKAGGLVPEGNRTDFQAGIFESVTGEMLMNRSKCRLTIDTPRLQGLTALKGDAWRFKDVDLRKLGVDAAVALASIDGEKPLNKASRILLVIASDAVNSESMFMNRYRLDIKPKMGWPKQLGRQPLLLETGEIDLVLRTDRAKTLKLWAINVDGTRTEEIPLVQDGEGVRIQFDTAKLKSPTVYFELAEK